MLIEDSWYMNNQKGPSLGLESYMNSIYVLHPNRQTLKLI